jgi:acyl carrier protein
VRDILETALGTPLPGDDATRADIEPWDSLLHLEVVFMLEEEFGVRFSAEEVAELNSVSAIVAILESKHAA